SHSHPQMPAGSIQPKPVLHATEQNPPESSVLAFLSACAIIRRKSSLELQVQTVTASWLETEEAQK
ncbi:MAG: hypothetical protein QGH15_10060, partial [Kiritimatiellia bacterium]|nr:hypothetical protein [Kiritimatiellia bacterium]